MKLFPLIDTHFIFFNYKITFKYKIIQCQVEDTLQLEKTTDRIQHHEQKFTWKDLEI